MIQDAVVEHLVLPCLTADLRGVGGVIKKIDEDFFVEEVPLYAPCGRGTHTYFTIEKRGLPTLAALRIIARELGRPPREIGYAGMKDAHGVTRQTLSIEHIDPQRVQSLKLSRIRVLAVSTHTNKIKLGHLAGNCFQIKIRDLASAAPLECAREVVEVLVARGVPNYFGPQRFGSRGDNARIGEAILRGDFADALSWLLGKPSRDEREGFQRARELFDRGEYSEAARAWPQGLFSQHARVCRAMAKKKGDAKKAWHAVDATLRRLYLSAFQSELFNRVLAARIHAIDEVQAGDMAYKHANGACFRVENPDIEQPRCRSFEISPTGPLFGSRTTPATGAPGELEGQVLRDSGVTTDRVTSARIVGSLSGARRPLRVPLTDAGVEQGADERGAFLRVGFFLPAGAYATSVLREICKNDGRELFSSGSPDPPE